MRSYDLDGLETFRRNDQVRTLVGGVIHWHTIDVVDHQGEPHAGWLPVCSCGWYGVPSYAQVDARDDAGRHIERMQNR